MICLGQFKLAAKRYSSYSDEAKVAAGPGVFKKKPLRKKTYTYYGEEELGQGA